MNSAGAKVSSPFHMVALPYPGRGHINPMMNLCVSLASKITDILITFVVTEEWLGFIRSHSKPDNIHFRSIPNVVPSELVRAADMEAFIEAISTKIEAPFERLLDMLDPPATVIMADSFLFWVVGLGNRRNIPVASFWPMSASIFSVFQHFHLFQQNGHFSANLQEIGEERIDYIPGISSTRLVDLPSFIDGKSQTMLQRILKAFSSLPIAQYLLFPSIYELESEVIDILRANFSLPIYPIGPALPFDHNSFANAYHSDLNYLNWLDCQPTSSVLYMSFGSFLSVSSVQMDEIAAGLCSSGVRFLWVARGETTRLREACGDMGLVVPWCDQLKVLCHSSIGGFWSHCGWNSTREGLFAGVTFLTFPIVMDQMQNAKQIVEDWKVGWRVKQRLGEDQLVTRDEVAEMVRKFMDLESDEKKEMRRRAREIQLICHRAIGEGGSSYSNINAFIEDISKFHAA